MWWLGARLMEERENACDEEVLRSGSDPEVYAGGILKICELYLASPLPCVSGVTGSNLKKRIEAIAAGSRGVRFPQGSFALPVLLGVLHAPPLMGQGEVSVPLSPPPGVQFRTASIEQCRTYVFGKIENPAPERLVANCVTTAELIHIAYVKSSIWDSADVRKPSDGVQQISFLRSWVGRKQ